MSSPELEDLKSDPMVWIGIYIAAASLLCDLAMAADLIDGFQNKKIWFPCKFFSLNAASIAMITVSMKLPVDLSMSEFTGSVDIRAKVGSLAFMCTMMANLMPSLAAMDNKTLLANITGLSILVITMIVNIFMYALTDDINYYLFKFVMAAYVYTAMMLLLLVTMIASSLTIPTSKEILEVKYQTTSKTLFADKHLQDSQTSKVEKLKQHVKRYWIMAETGSPQFVMASNPLSTASGVICVIGLLINLWVVLPILEPWYDARYSSEYKWSLRLIIITQFTGVMVGAIAPIFRCFSVLSFKSVSNPTHITVFKAESYWTQKLCEWKRNPIHFLSNSRSRTLVYNSKSAIISLCIRLQQVIVISCKVISLVPTFIPIFVVYCWKSGKARLLTPPVTRRNDNTDGNLKSYVLNFHDEAELGEKTLTRISNSVNSFILKAEKKQNKDLLELLDKSTGFKGVETFDTDEVQTLLSVELVNSWSLPIVTLTCIAVALPNTRKDAIKSLLRGVGEGLSYTYQVEESLNCEKQYVNVRKATIILWNEIEHKCKWLDEALQKHDFRGKTATEILTWFSDKGKETVIKMNSSINGEIVENAPRELIAANSMYRITETMLLRDKSNTVAITKKQLFALLSGMIADIFSACFTNLQGVIIVKCEERVIEKREASVKVAAELLGKTTKIIERLETRELPSMDLDKMAYVDEWRLYYKQSIP